jgi:uncharacterized protein (DUF2236 family)
MAESPEERVTSRSEHGFVGPHSIVRTIWGDPDMVLLIFAGSAAEFALNRAVDWLFVTGSLPNNPIGRLFSTVHYAQQIIFAREEKAQQMLASISAAHAAVERRRGQQIPGWAHRDVLYMLIDHSQRAYRLLKGPLKPADQADLYQTFLQVGRGLHISQLPPTFSEWQEDRERHLRQDLVRSEFTQRLFDQYRLHLGAWRYWILLEVQAMLVPERVRDLLRLRPKRLVLGPSVRLYALLRHLGLQPFVQRALIPYQYWDEMGALKRSAAALG